MVPSVFARVARYEVSRDQLEQAVAAFGEAGRQIEHLEGLAGGYVLVDNEDGRTMTLTLWDNAVALENSERQARNLRREAAEAAGGSVLSVESFEVAQELTAQSSRV
jgi:heme-degrading monooxygenase HmoA